MSDRVVWKYVLEVTDVQTVPMPVGAQVLSVQVQAGEVCLWARVRPNNPVAPRTFFIHGTGHPLDRDAGRHLGTFQLADGALVFHVFEPLFVSDNDELTLDQQALATLMSDLSEEYWRAGWMKDWEYELWGYVCKGSGGRDVAVVARLAEVVGCWIVWDDGKRAVPLDEWREMYASKIGVAK